MRRAVIGLLPSRVLVAAFGLVLMAASLVVHSGRALAAVGDITEYPVPTAASSPNGIALGSDGNVWFTETKANKVAMATTTGLITEYSIPTASSGPNGIAAGVDGNLWFAELNGNNIAKVTTSGVITEYPVLTPGSGPSSIVVGPDLNLWFTEASKVGKVTTSGVVTEYPLPSHAWNVPYFIAAGPDGNLWFTENHAKLVGKVTTSGSFTEYPVAFDPLGITSGPDGNLWITEFLGLTVAKMTTAGVATEYPVPASPWGIATGRDGNLWFTEVNANKVAKITTSGAFTEYPVPTASSNPYNITAGLDGFLWFTESNANIVAKVDSSVTRPPPSVYSAIAPLRVLDTRTSGQTLGPLATLNLQLGAGGVPSNATAIVVNATVTNTSEPGFLTVYPAGTYQAVVSNLNWIAGETVANLVQVALGTGGGIAIYNSAVGSIDVVVDLQGYFAPPGSGTAGEFVPLPPNRITDTRPGSGWPNAGSTLVSAGSIDVQVTGAGGVPATGVRAVVLNATVTDTTDGSFLTAYPKGSALPLASNLNWLPGSTVPNRVIVPVGTGGIVTFYNAVGSADLIVDVNGYFTDSTASGSSFVQLTPGRILDTRDGTGGFNSKVGQGSVISVIVAGHGGVPLMSAPRPPTAVVLNVTATNPSAAGFLTVWPDLVLQPPASDLNFVAGQSVPNLVVVKIGADGRIDVYNAWGSTDVAFDIAGWYG